LKDLGRLLLPFYRKGPIRSALKALMPRKYRANVRELFRPAQETQWCRVVMNRAIEKFIRSVDCGRMDVLEISGAGSQGKYDFRSYKSVGYPEYDVCAGPLAKEQFDIVIAEQVFEHILRPDKAATNVYEMLRPGGIFVISTPFLVKIHQQPLDLYRWTEKGMRQLLETAMFTVLATGSWGNLECLAADMQPGLGWTAYDPIKHSLHNEPQFPIVVWSFAKKGPWQ
jgi:SAM-dependent methyltransferase